MSDSGRQIGDCIHAAPRETCRRLIGERETAEAQVTRLTEEDAALKESRDSWIDRWHTAVDERATFRSKSDALEAENSALKSAITTAGFGIMTAGGKLSLHDVSEKAKADDERTTEIIVKNAELEAENSKLKTRLEILRATESQMETEAAGLKRDLAARLAECQEKWALIERQKAENAALRAELDKWKPLTYEEAQKAYDEAEALPMSEETIKRIVDFALDPASSVPNGDTAQMAADNKRLRAENAELKRRVEDWHPLRRLLGLADDADVGVVMNAIDKKNTTIYGLERRVAELQEQRDAKHDRMIEAELREKAARERIAELEEVIREADDRLCDCNRTLPCGSVCNWCSSTSDQKVKAKVAAAKKRDKATVALAKRLSERCKPSPEATPHAPDHIAEVGKMVATPATAEEAFREWWGSQFFRDSISKRDASIGYIVAHERQQSFIDAKDAEIAALTKERDAWKQSSTSAREELETWYECSRPLRSSPSNSAKPIA